MVRGGKVVAATIALLERQQLHAVRNKLPQPQKPASAPQRENNSPENVDSSMDESTIKCVSSTDSGKDDNSITTSNSSMSSSSDKEFNTEGIEAVLELSTVCCEEDFQWVSHNKEDPRRRKREKSEHREMMNNSSHHQHHHQPQQHHHQLPNHPEVRLRKPSSSLDRAGRRQSRKERDQKAKSTSNFRPHSPPPPREHYTSQHDLAYLQYCDRHHCSSQHDCRIPCQKDYYHYYRPFPCECSYRYLHKPTTELEEQLRRLESDRESLSLQVAVLTDQVEAQTEKINDLEKTIAEQKRQLNASDDLLQREMLTRSSLETQKLELLAVVSELKRHEATLERDNLELRERLAEERRKNKPPLAPRSHIYPTASTPTNVQAISRGVSPSPSPVSLNHSPRKVETDPESTPLLQRIGGGQYRSLPRDRGDGGDGTPKRGVVFGRATLTNDQPRCSSVPNLAETENVVINDSEVDGHMYSQEASPSMQVNAPKGIRKIFGKVKRSGSGNLEDLTHEENFTRGGIRSTAGPRLCSNSQSNNTRNETPFSEWTVDNVCDWLRELGLENSIADAKRWVKSGATILSASQQEVDKELNVKSGLLRKKLHLAIHCQREDTDALLLASSRLEPAWVLRWLDDIGLPQYKHNFMTVHLDGRMLHRLTMDDVQTMHITSALHVASIRTGIQVLRKENFDPTCLIRRSDPESEGNEGEDRVELWTNHRVMEWLRVVDLAEYAPNLRGSGVHGGLMMHEDRFNATLLASLLSIPPEKTLLRRHLSTHFTQLLGSDVIQQKRQAESSLGYVPLTTSLKIKVSKKSQFTLKRKKSKYDLDDGELVCPLNESGKNSQSTVTKTRGCLS